MAVLRETQTRDTILAYAVELTGTEQGKIKGNLYELDYLQHFREVIENPYPPTTTWRSYYERMGS